MDEALSILKEVVRSIPETSYGVERQMLIGDLVSRLSQEERVLVKRMFDSFLMRMFEITASDIDIGGTGARGYIWYFIHGETATAVIYTLSLHDALPTALGNQRLTD